MICDNFRLEFLVTSAIIFTMYNEETCLSGNNSSIAEFSKVLSFIVLSLNVIGCQYFTIPRDSNNKYLKSSNQF